MIHDTIKITYFLKKWDTVLWPFLNIRLKIPPVFRIRAFSGLQAYTNKIKTAQRSCGLLFCAENCLLTESYIAIHNLISESCWTIIIVNLYAGYIWTVEKNTSVYLMKIKAKPNYLFQLSTTFINTKKNS